MENIEVRKVTLRDTKQLQAIGRQTFIETFAGQNSPDDMKKYLEASFNKAKLTEELTDPDSEFYFALLHTKTIGYLKINFRQAQTELKDNRSVEIERIYILRDFHGRKAGQALYDTALNSARREDADYIWLGVWEKNQRAIDFYRKNGFVEFDRHIFRLGNDEQTDVMMRLKLT